MQHSAIAVLVLGACMALPALQDPARPLQRVDFGQEIFHAVLEGLYEDGVSNPTVDLVLTEDADGGFTHFVRGCPICIYVVEAMRHYRARPDFVSFKGKGNTWGEGLPAATRARLRSEDLGTRLEVLHGLVQRWMDRRMDRLRLDATERTRWSDHMEERSKKGMAMLALERQAGRMAEWGNSRCPSCEGAVAGAIGR